MIKNKRYCIVEKSVEESLKEVKLMREGKLPKRSWRDSFTKLKEELNSKQDKRRV